MDKENIDRDVELSIARDQAMDPSRAEWIIKDPSSSFKEIFLKGRGGMPVVEGVDG